MAEGTPDRARKLPEPPIPRILSVDTGPPHEGDSGIGLKLNTDLGLIPAILHESTQGNNTAVLWVWGARGGYAGPAGGIFANLSEEFTCQGISSLRLNYRYPGSYPDSVIDALCAIEMLKQRGLSRVLVAGHSFGGAVAIGAAAVSKYAVAVVSLSPQTYGAGGARALSPRPLLIVHGLEDTRLPPQCARQIYEWAQEPRELVLYPGAEHSLEECKDELHDLLRRWIPEKLAD